MIQNRTTDEAVVLDTKWKYQSDTSTQDVRQMYAYGHYLNAKRRYLAYPENLRGELVRKNDGFFYDLKIGDFSKKEVCGLMFVDLLDGDQSLIKKIGENILEKIFEV
jgi:5-methylcytosine-specific restriction enzyme subunit McrC